MLPVSSVSFSSQAGSLRISDADISAEARAFETALEPALVTLRTRGTGAEMGVLPRYRSQDPAFNSVTDYFQRQLEQMPREQVEAYEETVRFQPVKLFDVL